MLLLGRSYSFRFRQFVSTSLVGLAVVFANNPAWAADVESRPVDVTEVYLSVTGGYLFNRSEDNFSVDPTDNKVGNLEPLQPGSEAWFTALVMGQRIDSHWDWRASAQSIMSSEDDSAASPPNTGDTEWASNELSVITLDLEAGYHPDLIAGVDLRVSAGPRVVLAENNISYGYEDDGGGKLGELGQYDHENSVSAIGPRLGIDALIPLMEDGPRLVLASSGSVLFGDFEKDFSYDRTNTGRGGFNIANNGTIYNLEGSAGIQFNVLSNASLEFGYRAQQWWNLLESVDDAKSGDGEFSSSRTDAFMHGPYATFRLKLGSGR